MTGPEHYREAEKAIEASTWQRQTWSDSQTPPGELEMLYRGYMWEMARAQVHATLALAAATADPYGHETRWAEATR